LSAEQFVSLGVGIAGENLCKELRRCGLRKIGGARSRVPVVGSGTAELTKPVAADLEPAQVARPGRSIFASLLA